MQKIVNQKGEGFFVEIFRSYPCSSYVSVVNCLFKVKADGDKNGRQNDFRSVEHGSISPLE
jgi:hypothetical protein